MGFKLYTSICLHIYIYILNLDFDNRLISGFINLDRQSRRSDYTSDYEIASSRIQTIR